MKYLNRIFTFGFHSCIIFFLFVNQILMAQTVTQDHMSKLSFMIGEWVGISSTYKNDTIVKQVPAYEKIQYKLDENIITIDLASETLQLHTIIYYDDKDNKYYYNPYYKSGAGRYEAEFRDNKLIVWPTKNKRFIFQRTKEGDFKEYGEKLINGIWCIYFEDNFKKIF